MKEFSMKDLDKAKTIIRWEITQELSLDTLKIDQKGYIQDLFESKEMTFLPPYSSASKSLLYPFSRSVKRPQKS